MEEAVGRYLEVFLPFIATLIDALGIVLYLSLARWLLADLLPSEPRAG